jgi:hypothetical protein
MRTDKPAHVGPTTRVERGAPRWDDLATRGFVVVPGFLDTADLEILRQDFAAQALNLNRNLKTKPVAAGALARIRPKLDAAAAQVRAGGVVRVDTLTDGSYFATGLGVNEMWHQDHESYFLYQEHFHYLNFWIPIEKPDPERTNLCVLPFDALAARHPGAALVGNGAAHIATGGGRSTIYLDDRGGSVALDFDVSEIAVVPAVAAGDLVLLRGDVFHRTQDASTRRVAVSFRMINSASIVRKQRYFEGGSVKRWMLLRNPFVYAKAIQYFNEQRRAEISVGELRAFMHHGRFGVRATARALAELAFSWRPAR